MIVGRDINQLHIYQHLVADSLHATFENGRNTELPRDSFQIIGVTYIFSVEVRAITLSSPMSASLVSIISRIPAVK